MQLCTKDDICKRTLFLYPSVLPKMDNLKPTPAVMFEVVLEESNVKTLPKRVALMKHRGAKKVSLTVDEIKRRQDLAKERRQVPLHIWQ